MANQPGLISRTIFLISYNIRPFQYEVLSEYGSNHFDVNMHHLSGVEECFN
jgi:hypothetical protein